MYFAATDTRHPPGHADTVLADRKREADEFYHAVAAADLSEDERLVQRQAFAGLLWCKQFYNYAVRRWLKGDPEQPAPPRQRWGGARNHDWQHFAVSEVILMPDAWEYPWFAAWDLAFHCVALALIDPEFAKTQVLVLHNSTAQHPHGQIPAYEWKFGDTNPPVHAWAAWQVYQLDQLRTGVGDFDFLASAYRSATLNAMWWLNQKDDTNRGVFGGGFLGMDNIGGVFDRDEPLPTGGQLAQVDGTAWMAALIFHLLEMAIELSQTDPSYTDMFSRWVWDAWLVANSLEKKGTYQVSFWNDDTNFYHDVIEMPDGTSRSLEVFSIQAIVPLFAAIAIPTSATEVTTILTDCLGGAGTDLRAHRRRRAAGDDRRRRHPLDDRRHPPRPPHPHPAAAAGPRTVLVCQRDPLIVAVPSRPPVHLPHRRRRLRRRLSAGRITQPDVRRQLQLARSDLAADQFPSGAGAQLLCPVPRRHLPRSRSGGGRPTR